MSLTGKTNCRYTMPKKYYQHFDVLYQKSRIARYLEDSNSKTPYHSFTDHISPDDVVRELVAKRLATLEQMSLAELSDDARSNLTLIHIPDLPV